MMPKMRAEASGSASSGAEAIGGGARSRRCMDLPCENAGLGFGVPFPRLPSTRVGRSGRGPRLLARRGSGWRGFTKKLPLHQQHKTQGGRSMNERGKE